MFGKKGNDLNDTYFFFYKNMDIFIGHHFKTLKYVLNLRACVQKCTMLLKWWTELSKTVFAMVVRNMIDIEEALF